MPESKILVRYQTDQADLNKTLKAADQVQAAQEEMVRNAEKLNKVRSTEGGQFDVVSRQTAIYGDVESQIRTLTGALGYVGGEAGAAAEGLINVGAEMFAVREAAPKLVAGLGDVLGGLSGAGGLTGALAGATTGAAAAAIAFGAVALAVGALIVVVNELGKASEEQAKQVGALIDKTREVNDELATGSITQEDAAKRIEELNAKREAEQQLLEKLQGAEKELTDQYGALTGVAGIVNKQIPELNEQLGKSKDRIADFDAEIAVLEKALADGKIPAGEAAEVEQALATAREITAGATDQAAQAEQEAARKAEEAQREQERQAEQAQRQMEQAAEKAAQAQTNYANAIEDAGTAAVQAAQDARTKLSDSLTDLATNFRQQALEDATAQQQALADLQTDNYRDELRARKDFNRQVRDIIKEANRTQEDLLADRDFLALDQLAKQTERQLDDQEQAAKDAQRDRDTANKQELQDLTKQNERLRMERLRDAQRQRQELQLSAQRELRDIATNKQRQLELAATTLNRELELARQGQNAMLQQTKNFWNQMVATGPSTMGGGAASPGAAFRPTAVNSFLAQANQVGLIG